MSPSVYDAVLFGERMIKARAAGCSTILIFHNIFIILYCRPLRSVLEFDSYFHLDAPLSPVTRLPGRTTPMKNMATAPMAPMHPVEQTRALPLPFIRGDPFGVGRPAGT